MHSSEEVWALDDDHHDRVSDHTSRGFYIAPADAHVPHATGVILGCGPSELYPLLRICCESYSVTKTLLCSVLLLPGARLGSTSNLCQSSTRKAELTLLYGLQL